MARDKDYALGRVAENAGTIAHLTECLAKIDARLRVAPVKSEKRSQRAGEVRSPGPKSCYSSTRSRPGHLVRLTPRCRARKGDRARSRTQTPVIRLHLTSGELANARLSIRSRCPGRPGPSHPLPSGLTCIPHQDAATEVAAKSDEGPVRVPLGPDFLDFGPFVWWHVSSFP